MPALLRIPLLGALLSLSACTVPTPVIEKESPCATVTCDGHGTCAVEGGTNAVCLCQAGYRAEGSSCVAVVAGNECQGVTCSAHGSCVVVDGSPKSPLCICAAGFHSAGATTCLADPADPCADQTCSGHGSCAVQNGMSPVCVCEAGYSALGTMCVPKSADPCAGQLCSGHGTCAVANGTTAVCVCDTGYMGSGLACTAPISSDGGSSGLLFVPSSLTWSSSGRYASYTKVSISDAGPTTFDLGALVLRDLQTGMERVVDPVPPLNCTVGCRLSKSILFDDGDRRALVLTPKTTNDQNNYTPGEVIDVATGTSTPMTSFGWLQRVVSYSKDMSWAVVSRSTYLGNGGAIEWMPSLTGAIQTVAATCTDPNATSVDTVADGGTAQIAYWACTRGSNNTTTWRLSLTTMPGNATTVVTTLADSNFSSFSGTYQATGYIWYSVASTTWYVPIAANATPVSAGMGVLGNRSPNGRFATIGDFNGQSLVDLTNPTTAKVALGIIRRGEWRAPDVFLFKKSDDTLWSSTAGAAPVQLAAAGAVSDTFSVIAHGFIDTTASGSGQINVTVRAPTNTFTFPVPAAGRRTFFTDQGTSQDLGWWTYWSNGPTLSMRGQFYFDVLRGSAPDPANGFTFAPLP